MQLLGKNWLNKGLFAPSISDASANDEYRIASVIAELLQC